MGAIKGNGPGLTGSQSESETGMQQTYLQSGLPPAHCQAQPRSCGHLRPQAAGSVQGSINESPSMVISQSTFL